MKKKIEIKDIYKKDNSFREISFVGNFIFWIDNSLNYEGNNNAIFVRPFDKEDALPQQLTGDGFQIRSYFHGYGGKSYKCIQFKDMLYLIWIDQISQSIWVQIFYSHKTKYKSEGKYLYSNSQLPSKLTKSISGNFDASFELINGKLIFGLYENNSHDYLFSINIDSKNQDLKILKKFNNFAGSLSSNLGINIISWLEWKDPNMPWDMNNLYFAELSSKGDFKKIEKFNNQAINISKSVSFFQPYWISEDTLVCSEDSSGWWNLLFLEIKNIREIKIQKRIVKKFIEYGVPQWITGISLFSGLKSNFFCLAKNKDSWILEQYQNLSFIKQIHLPFTCLSDLHVISNKLILLASSNTSKRKLIEIDTNKIDQSRLLKYSRNSLRLSFRSESFWFSGFNKRQTHAWLYKPQMSCFSKPPLIIKAHSGPTSYYDGSLDLEVEFWTSRGWLVAEVNYGGSSGFGREYRERLNGKWGIVDSYDCNALAVNLIKDQIIDDERIVIFGNSAGGFTALNALFDNQIFKAAVCKYPVLDLYEMSINTHRFEKYYLNSLVGDMAQNKKKYFERSPMNKIEKINKSILLFHGKKDFVIDYKNTVAFNKKLLAENINAELYLFENEGHGFKDIRNKSKVLQKTEIFLNKILSI